MSRPTGEMIRAAVLRAVQSSGVALDSDHVPGLVRLDQVIAREMREPLDAWGEGFGDDDREVEA